ncbi:MAG: hypothetical protein KKC85_20215 [Gammaproteobacteria bacterium]|nr:hypothetical protein [Gammaproteobacteria bacterium]MBU1443010.1 hypothetical protein [Gammaproteobacteria bacterium]MBU2288734.1 hypothetical protein [Gammaproteobacteria bacterium]
MRFAILQGAVLSAADDRAALPPAIDAVKLQEDLRLDPTGPGARIHFSGHAPARTDDLSASELGLARLAIVEADSRDTVIEWLKRAQAADDRFEIRATGCPGGLPGVDTDTSANQPRFLVLVHADAATEAETAPAPARLQAMAKRNGDAVAARVLLSGDGLGSTAKAVRLRRAGASLGVMDGPFAEAKELIAGYWLIQVESLQAAIEWAVSYPYAQDDPVVDVLPVAA